MWLIYPFLTHRNMSNSYPIILACCTYSQFYWINMVKGIIPEPLCLKHLTNGKWGCVRAEPRINYPWHENRYQCLLHPHTIGHVIFIRKRYYLFKIHGQICNYLELVLSILDIFILNYTDMTH